MQACDSRRSRPLAAIGCAAILFAGALAPQVSLRAAEPELIAFRDHAAETLSQLPKVPDRENLLAQIAAAEFFSEVDAPLLSMTLATVAINPEARVKIVSAIERADLVAGRPQRFLVRVMNEAGIASPLRLHALDVSQVEPREAKWLSLRFVDRETGKASLEAAPLDGSTDRYLVVEVVAKESGAREARLSADAGQGTQDLGFRATADVLLRVSEPVDAP